MQGNQREAAKSKKHTHLFKHALVKDYQLNC